MVGGMGLDDKAKVKIVTTAVEESDEDEDENAAAPAAGKDQKGAPKKTRRSPRKMSELSTLPPVARGQ